MPQFNSRRQGRLKTVRLRHETVVSFTLQSRERAPTWQARANVHRDKTDVVISSATVVVALGRGGAPISADGSHPCTFGSLGTDHLLKKCDDLLIPAWQLKRKSPTFVARPATGTLPLSLNIK